MTGLSVHLAPSLVDPEQLIGSITVVVDILRATTTMVHALVAGASRITVVGEVDEAWQRSRSLEKDPTCSRGNGEAGPLKDLISAILLPNLPRDDALTAKSS